MGCGVGTNQSCPSTTIQCVTPRHTPSPVHDIVVQTSLAQFTALYERSIDQADRSVVPAKRVLHITGALGCSLGGGGWSLYAHVGAWLEDSVQVSHSLHCPSHPTHRSLYLCGLPVRVPWTL